jgi:hypothetical protein
MNPAIANNTNLEDKDFTEAYLLCQANAAENMTMANKIKQQLIIPLSVVTIRPPECSEK